MEEDSRFAVTFFPRCGEWGSVGYMARESLYIAYFKWQMVSSGEASASKNQNNIDQGRAFLQMLPIPYCCSTSIPSTAHREQVLRQTGPQYTPTGISQAKMSLKISISHNSEQGIIRALTQTPANPGITVHTESKALCEKVSAHFALSCYSCRLIQQQSSEMQPRNHRNSNIFMEKRCSECIQCRSYQLCYLVHKNCLDF